MHHTSEIHLFQAVTYLDAITRQKELKIREIQTATVSILTYQPSKSNIKKLIPDLGAITVDNIHIPVHGPIPSRPRNFIIKLVLLEVALFLGIGYSLFSCAEANFLFLILMNPNPRQLIWIMIHNILPCMTRTML